jgi:hypothetical protein
MMGADYYQTIEDMLGDREAKRPRIGVGEGTVVRRAIIDKNARIGANVKLLNEAGVEAFDAPDGSYYIRDRIIIVPKNGLIADGQWCETPRRWRTRSSSILLCALRSCFAPLREICLLPWLSTQSRKKKT